jgi:hypothetical protein
MSERADPQSDLATFCHRLGSPLGTLVNHLYLLELDQDAMPVGARESLKATRGAADSIRTLLGRARAWMDAHNRTLRARRLDSETLESMLRVPVPSPAGACLDPDALAHLLKDLRADGERTTATCTPERAELVFTSGHDVGADMAESDLELHPLASRCLVPHWASARVLAARLGLEVKLRAGSSGKLEAAVTVPLDGGTNSR